MADLIYRVTITNMRMRSLKEMEKDLNRTDLLGEPKFIPLYKWDTKYLSNLPEGFENLEKEINNLAQDMAIKSRKDVTIKLTIKKE